MLKHSVAGFIAFLVLFIGVLGGGSTVQAAVLHTDTVAVVQTGALVKAELSPSQMADVRGGDLWHGIAVGLIVAGVIIMAFTGIGIVGAVVAGDIAVASWLGTCFVGATATAAVGSIACDAMHGC